VLDTGRALSGVPAVAMGVQNSKATGRRSVGSGALQGRRPKRQDGGRKVQRNCRTIKERIVHAARAGVRGEGVQTSNGGGGDGREVKQIDCYDNSWRSTPCNLA